MGVGAAGYLPPVAGALFQELIDLAVILNALRALPAERAETRRRSARTDPLLDHAQGRRHVGTA